MSLEEIDLIDGQLGPEEDLADGQDRGDEDVLRVGPGSRPGDDPAIHKDRLAEHDVGQVGAGAGISVVANEHVARLHLLDRVAL